MTAARGKVNRYTRALSKSCESKSYEVAAYYFPNFHVDPRNEAAHGTGWTKWELVSRAAPHFADHAQPRFPLWGEEDEADPAVMAKKINAAATHRISPFAFDWCWYNEGLFLQRALDEGFLCASTDERLLNRFRAKVKAAGFDGLHLNWIVWGVPILPGGEAVTDPNAVLDTLGLDRVGTYWAKIGPFQRPAAGL